MKSHKQQFSDALDGEIERSLRVLRAYPDDQSGFRPHAKSRTAREVAWPMALGLDRLILGALTQGSRFGAGGNPPSAPPGPPEMVSAVAAAVEAAHAKIAARLREMDDAALDVMVKFFVAPKTMGDVPMVDFLWSILFDHIHHRGQLSVYLKIVGDVPSIYGPSASQPWR